MAFPYGHYDDMLAARRWEDYAANPDVDYSGGSNPSVLDPLQARPPSVASTIGKGASETAGLTAALGPIGTAVGIGSTILDTIANIYYQADYKKAMAKNARLAQKIYDQQRADEQAAIGRAEEKEQYGRGIYAKEWAYKVGQDKKSEDWTKKQDRYNKYLQFVTNFNSYLNMTPQIRQNQIQNWAAL